MKVAAGIVLYNPKLDRLKKVVDSIFKQVDALFVYDNHSTNISEIESLLSDYYNVVILRGMKNVGVAVALNAITKACSDSECKWLLTLDQDSVCPTDMISKFLKYIFKRKVAILCPRIVDIRQVYRYAFLLPPETDCQEISLCITAGSFINVDILIKLGGLDEFLFIDYVDYEYCYRLHVNNYKIYQINKIVLDQELGDLVYNKHADFYLKWGKNLHSRLIMSFACKKRYSALRRYYCTRNYIYCYKKYPKYIRKSEVVVSLIKISIKMLLLADNRLQVVRAIIEGIKDGNKLKIAPYKPVCK